MNQIKSFQITGLLFFLFFQACGTGQEMTEASTQSDTSISTKEDKRENGLHEEKEIGIRFQLPEGWHRVDKSEGGVHVILYGPDKKDLSTRMTLLVFPQLFVPEGLNTRKAQIKASLGDKYKEIRKEPFKNAKLSGELLEYEIDTIKQIIRTIEYAVKREDKIWFIQFASPSSDWEKIEKLSDEILASIEFQEAQSAEKKEEIEEKTYEDFVSKVRIDSHSIELTINPETGAFESKDLIQITALENDVSQADFLLSDFPKISAEDSKGTLDYNLALFREETDVKKVSVLLRKGLNKGESTQFTVKASTDSYDFRIQDTPIGGYNILGQISKDSSYSSHVLYYPLDAKNQANATIHFSVPEGYIAVGPGKLMGQKKENNRVIYTWKANDTLIKQLPYGWAIARYDTVEKTSSSGVPIRIYALPEHSSRMKNVLKVAIDVINFYEKRFGPFPFDSISIANVKPVQGIAGVSLPSLILLSEQFFKGTDSYDIIKTDIEASFRGPLVIADELSHQYNFYSVAMPNQFAEGLAQYTDSIFAEHVGEADLNEHFFYYSRNYRGAISVAPDRPILSNSVYKTSAYMGIVFNKGACILHMLRNILGDQVFFNSLKTLFTTYRGKGAGIEEFQEIVNKESGKNFDWFFTQWYTKNGYPKLTLNWKQSKNSLELILQQTQEGDAFRLPIKLSVTSDGTTKEIEIEMKQKDQNFSIPVQGKVESVEPSKSFPILADWTQ